MIKTLLFSLAASLGAAAVAWGLRLEAADEREWYRDIGDYNSSKLKAHRGLKWVFWGVITEMILGFALTAWDGWEISQANVKAIKNDPLNQPVFDLSASVYIRLKGHDFKEVTLNNTWKADISMFSSWNGSNGFITSVPMVDIGDLECESFQRILPWEDHGYILYFHPNYSSMPGDWEMLKGGQATTPTARQIVNNIGVLEIRAYFVSTNDEVVSGMVNLLINGSIREKFQIYPQKAWPGGFSFSAFTMFATNSNNNFIRPTFSKNAR